MAAAPTASASVSTGRGGLLVVISIANGGSEPLNLSTATFAPSLALEVTDAGGRRLPLGPPPMPPADLSATVTTIDPGGALSLSYSAGEMFPGGPEPGRYRLRFATEVPAVDGAWAGRIESEWLEFSL
jgi:hypothetical protein